MVANVDVLEIYYRVVIEQAMQAFDIMRSKINAIQHAVAELKGLRKLEQDLKTVGLGAMKSGRFFDLLTGKIVSTNDALRRFDFLSRKGTFFGKSAADIGNIPDITPKAKTGGGTGAQDLIDSVTKDIKKQGMAGQKTIDKLNSSFERLTTGVKKTGMAMMGFGLSMLFTGMAIKRFGDMALRSLVNNFMTLADENNAAVKAILSVQAAFGYLKFVIMDTLSRSELFQSFVTWLVKAAIAIGQFVEKNPKVAELIGIFLSLSVILGTVMMILGQMSLFAVGLEIALLPLIGILAIIAFTITALFYIWRSDFSLMTKIIYSVALALIAFIGIISLVGLKVKWVASIFVWLGKNPIVWVILGLILVIGVLANMIKSVGGVGNAFKTMGAGVVKIIALMGGFIFDKLITPVRFLIKLLANVAGALGKTELASKLNYATKFLDNLSFENTAGDVATKIDKMFGIDKIRAENPAVDQGALDTFLNMIGGVSGGSPVDTTGNGSSNLTSINQAQLDIDKNNAASLTDIKAQTEKANEMRVNLLIEQKEANNKLEEIKELLDEYGLTPSTNT